MELSIIAVGKCKEAWLKEAIAEYQKRLKSRMKLRIHEIDTRSLAALPEGERVKREGQLILAALPRSAALVLLDVAGASLSSEDFACLLARDVLSSQKQVAFVLGGPSGVSKDIADKASKTVSLSKLTFTHQMARLILIEQLYRALQILDNHPYHRAN